MAKSLASTSARFKAEQACRLPMRSALFSVFFLISYLTFHA